MQLFRKISAFICLAIFGVLILHNVMPHVHHSHDDLELVADNGTHEHAHDHHSDDDGLNDLISFLLNYHYHGYHVEEIFPFELKDKKGSVEKAFQDDVNHDFLSIATTFNTNILSKKYSPFKEAYFDNPFLLYCSLRAPPYFG